MTTEQKAKAYEETIEKAKRLKWANPFDTVSDMIDYIFPELAESEDEKIRKAIADSLKNIAKYDTSGMLTFGKVTLEKCLAWLEKQGKQKSTTKAEINQNLQDNSSRKMFEQKTDDKNEPFKIEAGKWYTCIVDGLAFFAKNNVYYCSEDGYLDQWGKGLTEKPIFINSDSLMKFRPATKEEIPHEPEFKVGDWVIDTTFAIEDYKGAVGQIEEIVHLDNRTLPYYKIADYSQKYKAYLQPISEHYLRDWTIQDAKDGDVLVDSTNGHPFIFNGKFNKNGYPIAYCGIDTEGGFSKSEMRNRWIDSVNILPATQFQKDTFFEAMADAGYEWDAEKKELKKIEQAHCTGVGEQEETGVLKQLLDEQKPAEWSEEDEKILNCIITDYEGEIANLSDIPIGKQAEVLYRQYISWLKSLRPQPKQKWSEEDDAKWYGVIETEEYMLQVVRGAQKFDVGNKEIERQCEEELEWLKSLRPQKQWKPTDEQVESLVTAMRMIQNSSPLLESLKAT